MVNSCKLSSEECCLIQKMLSDLNMKYSLEVLDNNSYMVINKDTHRVYDFLEVFKSILSGVKVNKVMLSEYDNSVLDRVAFRLYECNM